MGSPLIICGMHRSGTSLVASALRHAGLALGDAMNRPGPGNPRGHFEDAEIWHLHEKMLAAAGHTAFSAGEDFAPVLRNGFERRAAALVAARAGQRAWGWKDPRTCLFLDFWQRLVPDACYLVLYRHPVDVVLSLLRRNTEPELRDEPRLAFTAWEVHNRRLLELVDRHPERCFVAQVPAVTADLEGLVERVAARFDLPLQAAGASSLLAAAELAPSLPTGQRPPWDRVIPESLELYERLQRVADMPGIEPPPGAAEETAESPAGRDLERLGLWLGESLLFDLLEARVLRRQQRAAAEGFAVALEQERGRVEAMRRELGGEQARVADLERRLAAMAALYEDAAVRRDALAENLAAIERSRGYGVVAAWWRLARRLRRAVDASADEGHGTAV